MIGLGLVLLYVAAVCGFGDTNLGTAVHGGADFLFWWYLICSSIGATILSIIGLVGGGVAVLPETSSEGRGVGVGIALVMFFVTLWVAFKTALLTVGCYLISLGVPVESAPADWNWTKAGIGFALIIFTLIFLRSKGSNTETKTKE